jgi:hypothetical protein
MSNLWEALRRIPVRAGILRISLMNFLIVSEKERNRDQSLEFVASKHGTWEDAVLQTQTICGFFNFILILLVGPIFG